MAHARWWSGGRRDHRGGMLEQWERRQRWLRCRRFDDDRRGELGFARHAEGRERVQPIKVGFIGAGKASAIDNTNELVIADATAKYVNDYLGGIAGRPLDLITCADLATPSGATDCANTLLADHVVAVVSSQQANPAAVMNVLKPAKVPYIPWIGADPSVLISGGRVHDHEPTHRLRGTDQGRTRGRRQEGRDRVGRRPRRQSASDVRRAVVQEGRDRPRHDVRAARDSRPHPANTECAFERRQGVLHRGRHLAVHEHAQGAEDARVHRQGDQQSELFARPLGEQHRWFRRVDLRQRLLDRPERPRHAAPACDRREVRARHADQRREHRQRAGRIRGRHRLHPGDDRSQPGERDTARASPRH